MTTGPDRQIGSPTSSLQLDSPVLVTGVAQVTSAEQRKPRPSYEVLTGGVFATLFIGVA